MFATYFFLPSPHNKFVSMVVFGVSMIPQPFYIFRILLRRRCPACDTPLEYLRQNNETRYAAGDCVTRYPACVVEV